MKILYVFVAHIDDLEFSCLGYLLNSKYDKIKVIIATTWEAKEKIFQKNLKLLKNNINKKNIIKHIDLEYINLGFEQRVIPTYFDKVKDKFYKKIDFNSDFDILTHDINDAHTDHRSLYDISLGLYKYANKFITIYSPEAINFKPNYFVELSKEQNNLKKDLLNNYNFNEEQSYAQKGSYFNDNRIDLPTHFALENFHGKDIESCEIYKIHKWLQN